MNKNHKMKDNAQPELSQPNNDSIRGYWNWEEDFPHENGYYRII